MAEIIRGKPLADKILAQCDADIEKLRSDGMTPALAIVLVGDDPASKIYIGRKRLACERLGIVCTVVELAADSSTAKVIATLKGYNEDSGVHGILVQQPLPAQIDAAAVVGAIDTAKDVDGLHPTNQGLLATRIDSGQPRPCTPVGCMHMLAACGVDPAGRNATVVGRSLIVGRPLALMLTDAGATVTVCHSRTADLAAACRGADILAVAAGRPGLVGADMVKPGAFVLDIGTNRLADGSICGDVDHAAVAAVAGAITPVPGGVGPMTVAMLMRNTVAAARQAASR